MPLLKRKSKESDSKECSPKRGIAVAYTMKRNKKAAGGSVESGDPTMNMSKGGDPYSEMEESKRKNMAEGGDVDAQEQAAEQGNQQGGGLSSPDQQGAGSPVSGEEAKKFAQGMCPSCGYSEGGMVSNDVGEGEEADKKPNEFDDLVLRDGLEEHYTGANSGDEDNDNDIVKRAMKKRK